MKGTSLLSLLLLIGLNPTLSTWSDLSCTPKIEQVISIPTWMLVKVQGDLFPGNRLDRDVELFVCGFPSLPYFMASILPSLCLRPLVSASFILLFLFATMYL